MAQGFAGTLARPDNQEIVLNYIRKHGKIAGAGELVGINDDTVRKYLAKNLNFKLRVQLALENHKNGAVDDLQQHWNFHANEYNGKVIERILELLLEGERFYEVNACKVPKRSKTGELELDEFDEPVLETERVYEKTFWKPTPKWVIEIALQLMRNEYGKSDLMKIAPTIIVKLVQYVKQRGELIQGEVLQELIGLSEEFDDQIKQELMALRAKALN